MKEASLHPAAAAAPAAAATSPALTFLLVRYVIDIKVTVSWRTTPWHARALQGARHCSNTCYKVR